MSRYFDTRYAGADSPSIPGVRLPPGEFVPTPMTHAVFMVGLRRYLPTLDASELREIILAVCLNSITFSSGNTMRSIYSNILDMEKEEKRTIQFGSEGIGLRIQYLSSGQLKTLIINTCEHDTGDVTRNTIQHIVETIRARKYKPTTK